MDKDKIKKVIIVVIFTIVVTFAVFITTAELRFTEDTQDSFDVDETSSGFFNILQLADGFFNSDDEDSSDSDNSSSSRRPSNKRPSGNSAKPDSSKRPINKKPSNNNSSAKPDASKNPSAKPDSSGSDGIIGLTGSTNNDPGFIHHVWGEIKMFIEVLYGKADNIKLDIINEEDAINVKAIPMTKVTALRELKPYRFTLKNSGTVNLDANLSLDVLENTLDVPPEDVRVYIEDMYGNVIIDSTFANTQYLLEQDIRISRNMYRKFKLWAWVDSRVDSEAGNFKFKISAFGTEVKEVDYN